MFLTCLLFVPAVVFLYLYFAQNYDYWKSQNVASAPNPLPGFGHALPVLLVRENLTMWAERMYRLMGKRSMFGCYFMRTPVLLIRDPELIKSVLQTNYHSFRNNMIALDDKLDPILARNPFFARDEVWKRSRMILANNFTGRNLRSALEILKLVCDKFTVFVDDKVDVERGFAEFELKRLFARVTGEMVASAAFGIEGQSFAEPPDPRSFAAFAARLFDTTPLNGLALSLRFYFPRLADRLGIRLIPRETDEYFRRNVRAVVKSRLQDGARRSDFLQSIVDRMDEIDEDMAVAQATSIFFDGYETSSTALTFLVYRLAENPEIQERAREEVNRVLERYDGVLTYGAVKEMTYLEQAMHESIRMNMALGELAKVCTEEITLQGSDDARCHLKPGDLVFVSGTGLHMDEEFWPEPSKFDPERFSSANKAGRNKFTYLGFGEGARACIGMRMGVMTVKAVTAVVLRSYSLEVSSRTRLPMRMDPNTFAWIAKDGVYVRFKPLAEK